MNIVVIIPFFIILCGYLLYHIISWYYHKYVWCICTDQDIINMDYETKLYISDRYWHYTDLFKTHILEKHPIIGEVIYDDYNDIILYISSCEFRFYNNTKKILIDLIEVIFNKTEKCQQPYLYGDYIEIVYKQYTLIKLYHKNNIKYGVEAVFDLNKYYEKIKNVCSYTPHGYKQYEQNYIL